MLSLFFRCGLAWCWVFGVSSLSDWFFRSRQCYALRWAELLPRPGSSLHRAEGNVTHHLAASWSVSATYPVWGQFYTESVCLWVCVCVCDACGCDSASVWESMCVCASWCWLVCLSLCLCLAAVSVRFFLFPCSSLDAFYLSLKLTCFCLLSCPAGVLLQLPPYWNCQVRVSAQLQRRSLAPEWPQEWLHRSICLRCGGCHRLQCCLGNRNCLRHCGTERKDGTWHDGRGLVKVSGAWGQCTDCEIAGPRQSAELAGGYGAGWPGGGDVHSMLIGGGRERGWGQGRKVCRETVKRGLNTGVNSVREYFSAACLVHMCSSTWNFCPCFK